MMCDRGKLWNTDEMSCLLKVWGNDRMQEMLKKVARNKDLFTEIAHTLALMGFKGRNGEQCRTKINQMKTEYRKIVSGQSENQNNPPMWFAHMEAILTKKPSERNEESDRTLRARPAGRGLMIDGEEEDADNDDIIEILQAGHPGDDDPSDDEPPQDDDSPLNDLYGDPNSSQRLRDDYRTRPTKRRKLMRDEFLDSVEMNVEHCSLMEYINLRKDAETARADAEIARRNSFIQDRKAGIAREHAFLQQRKVDKMKEELLKAQKFNEELRRRLLQKELRSASEEKKVDLVDAGIQTELTEDI